MSNWTEVATEADLFEGAGIAVTVDGHEIALFKTATGVFATDNACTHGPARLCEGWIEGDEVECPLHQGRFDLHTGTVTCGPASQDLRCWPVRMEGGRVYIQLT
jgi:naphthalene 1,2-dioxygenase system ferredoxin subunit